jgi:hypothetical protein
MGSKLLVAFTSKYGAMKEIAEKMGEKLRQAEHLASVMHTVDYTCTKAGREGWKIYANPGRTTSSPNKSARRLRYCPITLTIAKFCQMLKTNTSGNDVFFSDDPARIKICLNQ